MVNFLIYCAIVQLIYCAISFNSRSIWIQILQLKAIICLELEITFSCFFLYQTKRIFMQVHTFILIFMLVWLSKQYLFQVCRWYCTTFDICVYIAFSKVILIHNSTQIQKIYHVRKYINKIKYQQNNADIFFIIKTCFMFYNS